MFEDIINQIKRKKPLDRLDNDFINYFIETFLKRNQKIKLKFQNDKLKKKDIKEVVKGTRNILNRAYSQFWLDDTINVDSHKSYIERKDFYKELYKKIFEITGKPRKILDLGAGLNVLSYHLIKDCYFVATELTNYDCELLKEYFKKNKINSEIMKTNLLVDRDFPEADVCFMFKILDSLDLESHKISEELIKCVKARYLVVSFSKVTTRNKKMNYPRRGWFERMLKRLGYKFNKLEFSNEIFYVVKKE